MEKKQFRGHFRLQVSKELRLGHVILFEFLLPSVLSTTLRLIKERFTEEHMVTAQVFKTDYIATIT